MRLPTKLVCLIALLPVTTLFLAACETLGLSSSPDSASPDTAAAAPAPAPAPVAAGVGSPCPLSSVLSEASRVVFLRGEGQTTADIMVSADMSPARMECDYDPETRVDNINLNFPLTLNKGPAANADEQQISYFVALVNMAGEVIAKRVYQRRVVFGGKQSFIATEKVENLVLTLGPGTRPQDHRILIGFQLTPEQLAYNRLRATTPLPTPVAPVVAAPAPPPAGATPAPGAAPAAAATPAAGGRTAPATAAATPPPAPTPPPRAEPTSRAVQPAPDDEDDDETETAAAPAGAAPATPAAASPPATGATPAADQPAPAPTEPTPAPTEPAPAPPPGQ